MCVGKDDKYGPSRLLTLANGVVSLANNIVYDDADTLVLLDKSARPVAQLLEAYWRNAYTDRQIPNIRFMNIGLESGEKDSNPKFLKMLYNSHFQALNGKTVVVADEAICTGSTLIRAKRLLGNVFPETKRIIYTAVFDNTPFWYGQPKYLGVYDLDQLPFSLERDRKEKLRKNEPDTHISKSLPGILRRNRDLKKHYIGQDLTIEGRQNLVNKLRVELSYIGEITAKCTVNLPFTAYKCDHHFYGPRLEEELNGKKR
jgi:hypoxanthine phosphoribosyltransferase